MRGHVRKVASPWVLGMTALVPILRPSPLAPWDSVSLPTSLTTGSPAICSAKAAPTFPTTGEVASSARKRTCGCPVLSLRVRIYARSDCRAQIRTSRRHIDRLRVRKCARSTRRALIRTLERRACRFRVRQCARSCLTRADTDSTPNDDRRAPCRRIRQTGKFLCCSS